MNDLRISGIEPSSVTKAKQTTGKDGKLTLKIMANNLKPTGILYVINHNKSCQKTTKFAERQPIKIDTFECHSKFKVKVIRSRIMVWCERSCHKEYKLEI